MTVRHIFGGFLLLAFIATGCGKISDDSDGAMGDGDGDSGDGDGTSAPQGATTMCGDTECRATAEEVKWGAQPCCLDGGDEVCGLESDNPAIIIPDLLGTGEMILPVADLIAMFAGMAGGDAGVEPAGTDMPVVGCMPKDQKGDPSVECAGAELPAGGMGGGGFPGAPAMDMDAGMTDAGMTMAAFEGCCRPDGYCGYLDTNTGFGCVKISESLIGMINGAEDTMCGN